MLPVFLNFPFVIASLVFPYVYMMTIWWRSRSFDVTCTKTNLGYIHTNGRISLEMNAKYIHLLLWHTKTNLGSKRIMWSKPSIVILQYEVFYWNILNEYYSDIHDSKLDHFCDATRFWNTFNYKYIHLLLWHN
jgi:hypothetical protein